MTLSSSIGLTALLIFALIALVGWAYGDHPAMSDTPEWVEMSTTVVLMACVAVAAVTALMAIWA